ncbi:MAG TPA: energy transducer TonB [Bacteroidales bacterium]|nr:energy transducer TonB [Bacteroidales bacterium]
MKLKKTNKANLDKKRVLFFEIGLLVALGAVLAAFEWGTEYKSEIDGWETRGTDTPIELFPPVTIPDMEKKVPARIPNEVIHITDLEVPDGMEPVFVDPGNYSIPTFEPGAGYVAPKEEIDDTPSQEFEVDIQAEFMKGGPDLFLKWVNENIKYPQVAVDNRIQGTQYVSFVIDKNGKLTNIKILREIDASLAAETLRVLNMSPLWKPAIKKGKVVAVQYQMPVNYRLQEL